MLIVSASSAQSGAYISSSLRGSSIPLPTLSSIYQSPYPPSGDSARCVSTHSLPISGAVPIRERTRWAIAQLKRRSNWPGEQKLYMGPSLAFGLDSLPRPNFQSQHWETTRKQVSCLSLPRNANNQSLFSFLSSTREKFNPHVLVCWSRTRSRECTQCRFQANVNCFRQERGRAK